jgi:hypothetical protein
VQVVWLEVLVAKGYGATDVDQTFRGYNSFQPMLLQAFHVALEPAVECLQVAIRAIAHYTWDTERSAKMPQRRWWPAFWWGWRADDPGKICG